MGALYYTDENLPTSGEKRILCFSLFGKNEHKEITQTFLKVKKILVIFVNARNREFTICFGEVDISKLPRR